MWETRNIEKMVQRALIRERGKIEGNQKFSQYLHARDHLEEILDQIRATQPTLTDHSLRHVMEVLDNAESLLGTESELKKSFSGTDLYCLALSILFHDVGNVFNREEHQHKVAEVYDYIRPDQERYRQEKWIILKAVEAHCGEAMDGSKDTLKLLHDQTALERKPVKLRQIAAILRLADELAEGPQRTSLFMQQQHFYPADSQIFHQYSNITSIHIDRRNERIALTYNIKIDTEDQITLSTEKEQELLELLRFTYDRIFKLDQERQYAKHYCQILSPFKATTVSINFWIDKRPYELGLLTLVLNDLVVPGDSHRELHEINTAYRRENIISKIHDFFQSRH